MWWGKRKKKSKICSKILIWETSDGYEPRGGWTYRKKSNIGKGGKHYKKQTIEAMITCSRWKSQEKTEEDYVIHTKRQCKKSVTML